MLNRACPTSDSLSVSGKIVSRVNLDEYWLTEDGVYRFQWTPKLYILPGALPFAVVTAIFNFLPPFLGWFLLALAFVPSSAISLRLVKHYRRRMEEIERLPLEEGAAQATEKIVWSFVERLAVVPGYRLKARLKPLTDYSYPSDRSLEHFDPVDFQRLRDLASSKIGDSFVLDERWATI